MDSLLATCLQNNWESNDTNLIDYVGCGAIKKNNNKTTRHVRMYINKPHFMSLLNSFPLKHSANSVRSSATATNTRTMKFSVMYYYWKCLFLKIARSNIILNFKDNSIILIVYRYFGRLSSCFLAAGFCWPLAWTELRELEGRVDA